MQGGFRTLSCMSYLFNDIGSSIIVSVPAQVPHEKMKLLPSRYSEHDTIIPTRNTSMIHKLLYDGSNTLIDDRTLFGDLDMENASQYTSITHTTDIHNLAAPISDLHHILTICDKLLQHNTIGKILEELVHNCDNTHKIPHAQLIVNHQLSNNALIELYTETNAYKLLYGCIYYDTRCITSKYRMLRDATCNGLPITSMYINDKSMHDSHIQYCTSLTSLNVYKGCKITACAPFAESLKILHTEGSGGLCNDSFKLCASIVELHAENNYRITTCVPFANSLKILDASNTCGIRDSGLILCHSITELFANNNVKITTCAPFAKTLKILNAARNCGISDVGIAMCHSIKNWKHVVMLKLQRVNRLRKR